MDSIDRGVYGFSLLVHDLVKDSSLGEGSFELSAYGFICSLALVIAKE